MTFKSKGQSVLIKCIYAPYEDSNPNDDNNDSSMFYKEVLDDTDEERFDNRLITGDYNVAMDHKLDTSRYLHGNNPNTRELLTRQANMSIFGV